MALFVNQENTRTKLQKRVAAELADKAKKKELSESERPDGVDDSAYLEKTKSTTSLAGAWIVIVAAVILIAIWLIIQSM